jgi:hypothetical protein
MIEQFIITNPASGYCCLHSVPQCHIKTSMRKGWAVGDKFNVGSLLSFFAADAASFVTGHPLVVDGAILASSVNQ